MPDALLNVDSIRAGYGDFQALFEPSVHVNSGETVAIIGANGAGKSTLLRAIAGQVRVSGGSMTYRGNDLSALSAHRRVGLGISLVPEGRRLFPSLSVQENLLIGGHRSRHGKWNLETVLELFPLIRPLLKRSAAKLSGGEQQAIAIGRALMANPELLLLDEVSLGLAPVVVKGIYSALPGIVESGTTVVLVEQDITLALGAADRVYCMLEGRVSLTGPAGELSHDAITTAYFGVD
ncbi:MAG: ABC transporter ATP-binding protein [Ilumatobacteraceae bacterium]